MPKTTQLEIKVWELLRRNEVLLPQVSLRAPRLMVKGLGVQPWLCSHFPCDLG